jgi:hypothetical protein
MDYFFANWDILQKNIYIDKDDKDVLKVIDISIYKIVRKLYEKRFITLDICYWE